jgi:hypothetical protein
MPKWVGADRFGGDGVSILVGRLLVTLGEGGRRGNRPLCVIIGRTTRVLGSFNLDEE